MICLAITSAIALDPCDQKHNKCPPGYKHVACHPKTAAVSSVPSDSLVVYKLFENQFGKTKQNQNMIILGVWAAMQR